MDSFPDEWGKWTLISRWGGKWVFSWVAVGPSLFLSSGDGYVWELLELPQGCQGPFRGWRVKVGFLKRPQRRASSRVEGRNSWFSSSWDRKLGVPLELRRGPQGPARVASGKSSLHSSSEGPLRIPLHSVRGPRFSSGVYTRTSGFLSSADMDLGVPTEFEQGSQVSSPMETCNTALLSSWKISVRLPVELTLGSAVFSQGATGLSHMPSCFESILRVTVESVQGNPVYLELIWTLGSFWIVAWCREGVHEIRLMTRSYWRSWQCKSDEVSRGPLPEHLPPNQNLSVLLFHVSHQHLWH